MNEELKATLHAIWSKKITSEDEFNAARDATMALPQFYDGPEPLTYKVSNIGYETQHLFIGNDAFHETDWPILRDVWREAMGLYPEASSVLKHLRVNTSAAPHFPHVSKDDPTKVAFTLDRQGALDDRKVLTSMGRLLRKFLIHHSDSDIQKLEQMHQAEIDGVFEIAGTAEEVERIYTTMRGDSGCMRYEREHWPSLNQIDAHPSHVYAAPELGLSVAYLQDAEGNPTARSVIYTNPDDPSDKRYVRVYGDTSLAARLARAGYRKFGLAGARIPAIALDPKEYPNQFVLPYMDPAGGYQDKSADRSKDASYVVRFKGENFLRLVDLARGKELQRAGALISSITTQEGRVVLKAFDTEWMYYTCAVTGEKHDATVTPFNWFYIDGQPQKVSQTWRQHQNELGADIVTMTLYNEDNESARLYLKREDREKASVPGHAGIYNNEPTIRAYGLAKLSEVVYGEPRYVNASHTTTVLIDGAEHVVERTRTVSLHDYNAETGHTTVQSVLDEMAKELPKKQWVRLHKSTKTSSERYARIGHPQLVKTVSGRSVLTNIYDVNQMPDGRWDFSKNLTSARFGRLHMNLPKVGIIESVSDEVAQAWVKIYGHYVEDFTEPVELTGHIMGYSANGGPWYWYDDKLTVYHRDDTRIERARQMVAAADFITSQPRENVEAHATYLTNKALTWGRVAKAIHTAVEALYAKREAERLAALQATEAQAQGFSEAAVQAVEEDLTF